MFNHFQNQRYEVANNFYKVKNKKEKIKTKKILGTTSDYENKIIWRAKKKKK